MYTTAGGSTGTGAVSNSVTNDGTHGQNTITLVPTGSPALLAYITARVICRNKVADQSNWYVQQTIANGTGGTGVQDNTADTSLGALCSTVNTAADTHFVFGNDGSIQNAASGAKFVVNGAGQISTTGSIAASAYTTSGGPFLTISGANSWQMKDHAQTGFTSLILGVDSATPAPSPGIRGANGVGTDIAGGGFVVQAGAGTGLGGGGDVRLQTTPKGTTGSTTNVYTDRMVLAGKQVTLTESSATAVADVGIAAGTVTGGTLTYTIRADDATNFQALRGHVPFSAVNKAGTITATVGTPIEITSLSSGTLTNTVTITNSGGNLITLNLNAVSSLTQTTLVAYVRIDHDGTGLVTTH
jgi:hypothetical protein